MKQPNIIIFFFGILLFLCFFDYLIVEVIYKIYKLSLFINEQNWFLSMIITLISSFCFIFIARQISKHLFANVIGYLSLYIPNNKYKTPLATFLLVINILFLSFFLWNSYSTGFWSFILYGSTTFSLIAIHFVAFLTLKISSE